jgi:hypothetical protein
MRGSVAMKLSDTSAHVCMGDGEVKAGDKMILYNNDCSHNRGCREGEVGTGHVTEILNEHDSAIEVDPGAQFGEGTIVEKER